MPSALITGGHAGIGYSCARHLASHFKWDLLLAGRSPERMNLSVVKINGAFDPVL